METKDTKVSSFLGSLLPEFKTEVGFNPVQSMQMAAILVIAAVLVIFSFFALKKIMK